MHFFEFKVDSNNRVASIVLYTTDVSSCLTEREHSLAIVDGILSQNGYSNPDPSAPELAERNVIIMNTQPLAFPTPRRKMLIVYEITYVRIRYL